MQIYTGVVENRMDPLKLGRCQVRVVGVHTHDKSRLPTEDLPWAYPMQPLNSAAMSGIGVSPTGPVEGTWVVILFRDFPENQQPIIIGTVGGIPQEISAIEETTNTNVLKDEYGVSTNSAFVVDDDGNIVRSGDPIEENTSTTATYTGARPIRDFSSISADGVTLIKRFEALQLTASQRTDGVWIVGYGTSRINGQSVEPNRKITETEAENFLQEDLDNYILPRLKTRVRSLVTQSMVDALACFVYSYNVGTDNFDSSTVRSELNSSKYLNAAAEFGDWATFNGTELDTLVRRRSSERDLFLKDGIPNIAGGLTPVEQVTSAIGTQTTDSKGNLIVSNGMPTGAAALGFRDPKGKYPLYINEADTNRLARNENITDTIVFKKDAARDKDVPIANSSDTWSQTKIPYNATYPFNHVQFTESGHVLEFDDTQHSERIHLYHTAGTFTEIDANGTKTNRIVGDGYEILERNGYVHIKGSQYVTVDGAQKVRVDNTLDLEVKGVATINVYNDANVNVSGNANMSVKETFNLKAKTVKLESTENFNIKAGNNLFISSGVDTNIKATGNFAADYTRGDFGNGATEATSTGLSTPAATAVTIAPTFNDLIVVNRASESSFETPDEGNSEVYVARQLESGTLASDEIGTPTESREFAPSRNTVDPGDQNCDLIFTSTNFPPSLVLSKYFTVGDLNKQGARPIVKQQGLSKQEIACNLKGLCENVLDPIKAKYPNMIITSGFRRPGDVKDSAKTSQHYLGQAADIFFTGWSREKHYKAALEIQKLIPYDQLILEYKGATDVWIHISFKYSANRKEHFTMNNHKGYPKRGDKGKFYLLA